MQTSRTFFGLRTRDQFLFAVVSGFSLLSLAGYCSRTGCWGEAAIKLNRPAENRYDYRIELNSATWVEWSQLPGIGPVLAQRIVSNRVEEGPFRGVDDLARVPGLGAKRLTDIRPHIRVRSTGPALGPEHGEPVAAGGLEPDE